MRREWSSGDLSELCLLQGAGVKLRVVAALLGRSVQTVVAASRRHGGVWDAWIPGVATVVEVGRRTWWRDDADAVLREVLFRRGRIHSPGWVLAPDWQGDPWTFDSRGLVVELALRGIRTETIAALMRRTPEAIRMSIKLSGAASLPLVEMAKAVREECGGASAATPEQVVSLLRAMAQLGRDEMWRRASVSA